VRGGGVGEETYSDAWFFFGEEAGKASLVESVKINLLPQMAVNLLLQGLALFVIYSLRCFGPCNPHFGTASGQVACKLGGIGGSS
jgi:hypothetical protein